MPYLEMQGIRKQYPGVTANDGVDLSVEAGEIHALVGENGAGKSTLMKILYGLEQPDAGEIRLNGAPVRISTPRAAIQLGIGMVHQHFQLIPSLTVAENVALGYEPNRNMLVDFAAMRNRVSEISATFGLKVDPTARVSDLSVGVQQRVEILKLLYRDARLLILDEPSAVLTPQEVEDLFAVLRRLVQEGRTAIFITHKLYEIMSICQQATVLRRGKVVGNVQVAASSPAEVARLMVGHDVEPPPRAEPVAISQTNRLVVRSVGARDDRGLAALKDIGFFVRGGEILGIAGVEGNGQHELVEVLVGRRQVLTGDIIVDDRPVSRLGTRQRRAQGLAIIPDDRNREGLSRDMAIWENMIANGYFHEPQSRYGFLNIGAVKKAASALISQFDIRTPSEAVKVGSLSGGNAQKVVIARELERQPAVLIAAQPTRGLDVGAARFVHDQLLKLRGTGAGILLISADLDELLTISDRIAVLFQGRILKTFEQGQATREQLGLYMAGKGEAVA